MIEARIQSPEPQSAGHEERPAAVVARIAGAAALGFTLALPVSGGARSLPPHLAVADLTVDSPLLIAAAIVVLAMLLREYLGRAPRRTGEPTQKIAEMPRQASRRALQTPHFFLY